jgi:hypothetical protein
MRYNIPIFFQRKEPGAFDEATHNYKADTVTEVKRYAAVTITGTDTLQLVYGTIKQQSLTIKLLRPYNAAFDTIRIGSKIYAVGFSRGNKAFVISEVK